jgi:hypothetical protein
MNKKIGGNFSYQAGSLCFVYHAAIARRKICVWPDKRFAKSKKIDGGHVDGHSLLHKPF